MHKFTLSLAAILISATVIAADSPAAFTSPPRVKGKGDKVKISFSVDKPTDVAVSIENSAGHIVRHLAAGLLGDNAPAPLKKGSLKQSLTWDGKGDDGKKIPEGKYSVRVALGLTASYAGTVFEKERGPENLTNVIGLSAGPDGRIYVLTQRWRRIWWTATTMHVFLPDGSYEKTIKPMPSTVPPEKLEDLSAFKGPNGHMTPVVHRILAMSFYPFEDSTQHFAVTKDGKVAFVVTPAAYTKAPIQRLATIDTNGALPYEDYAGDILLEQTDTGRIHLATGSDGRTIYVVGVSAKHVGFNTAMANPPLIYTTSLPERKELKPWFGHPAKKGDGKDSLSDPRAIASDGERYLLIADRGNNRVLVLDEKKKKYKDAFAVPSPSWVGIHQKTKAVYVVSGNELIKFNGWKKGKEVARTSLPAISPKERKRARRFFALDPKSEPAVIWIGHSRGAHALMRTVEQDGKFSPFEKAKYRPSRTLWNLSVGVENKEVACKVGNATLRIMDEESGKSRDIRPTGSSGQTYILGPNGQIYGQDHAKYGVRRWDRNGKYLPFPATLGDKGLKGRLPNVPSGTTAWERGFCVDREGNVYARHRGPFYHGRKRVDVFDPDGNFKRTALWVVTDGMLGPRVDPAGNIYIADAIKPPKKMFPDVFKEPIYRFRTKQQYGWMYGSIIKFSPKGGALWFPQVVKQDGYAFEGKAKLPKGLKKEKFSCMSNGSMVKKLGEIEGAEWWRYGCSYVLDMHISHNQRCHCTAAEFDVDDFGRTFYPDQGLFQVGVLDTAGNEILRIGGYGNQDSCGPDSYVRDPKSNVLRPRLKDDPKDLTSPLAKPDIAIAWTTGLAVSDKYLYLADGLNRRVLRARLSYTTEAKAKIK